MLKIIEKKTQKDPKNDENIWRKNTTKRFRFFRFGVVFVFQMSNNNLDAKSYQQAIQIKKENKTKFSQKHEHSDILTRKI